MVMDDLHKVREAERLMTLAPDTYFVPAQVHEHFKEEAKKDRSAPVEDPKGGNENGHD
jgi:hypothetical protein